MAAAQFMTNADVSVENSTPKSLFQNLCWFQEDTKDESLQSNQLAWNEAVTGDDSNHGATHTISYFPYGAYQPGYGSYFQPEAVWWYGNYDQSAGVGSQESDQLAWGRYGAGYYPLVEDCRGGGVDVDGTSAWTGFARTIETGSGGTAWMMPKWYQPASDLALQYGDQCVKVEDDRDVTQQVDGPTAHSAPLIYQVY